MGQNIRLTKEQKTMLYAAIVSGMPDAEIARQAGCTRQNVSGYRRRMLESGDTPLEVAQNELFDSRARAMGFPQEALDACRKFDTNPPATHFSTGEPLEEWNAKLARQKAERARDRQFAEWLHEKGLDDADYGRGAQCESLEEAVKANALYVRGLRAQFNLEVPK